jgi:4-amino-4-deoxy-L-arabinose transferase-like glycosyltransferase
MFGGWLARLRWRRRGAWLWPTFAALTLFDGIIGLALPMSGDSQSLTGGILVGLVLNLLAVLAVSTPGGALLRRRRPDLPRLVARDYAGTIAVVLVAGAMAVIGLTHQSSIEANHRALSDALARAAAWMGDRAPAEFRANLEDLNTYTIEPGRLYRTCVQSRESRRTYCVIVKRNAPFGQSVTFAGYEPNSMFAAGAN